MTMTLEEKFVETLRHGVIYLREDIIQHLEHHIQHNASNYTQHDIRYDPAIDQYYIYDSECYMYIQDHAVILESHKPNCHSEGMCARVTIKNNDDIISAYRHFKTLTLELPEDEE